MVRMINRVSTPLSAILFWSTEGWVSSRSCVRATLSARYERKVPCLRYDSVPTGTPHTHVTNARRDTNGLRTAAYSAYAAFYMRAASRNFDERRIVVTFGCRMYWAGRWNAVNVYTRTYKFATRVKKENIHRKIIIRE